MLIETFHTNPNLKPLEQLILINQIRRTIICTDQIDELSTKTPIWQYIVDFFTEISSSPTGINYYMTLEMVWILTNICQASDLRVLFHHPIVVQKLSELLELNNPEIIYEVLLSLGNITSEPYLKPVLEIRVVLRCCDLINTTEDILCSSARVINNFARLKLIDAYFNPEVGRAITAILAGTNRAALGEAYWCLCNMT